MRLCRCGRPRENVRLRYNFRCGYCASHEDEVGARLTIDHYQPQARGGDDSEDNLVYCCHACNEFKGDWWSEDVEQQILHPLRDDTSAYLVERIDHLLIGLTERGRQHIAVLHLNRPELIAARRRRHRESNEDTIHQSLLNRLDNLETEMRRLSEHILRITGGIGFSEEDTTL